MDYTPAREVLGSDVIVGCPMQSKGLMARNAGAAAVGGMAGVLVAKMLQKDKTEVTSPGGHIGQVYVCLGDTRVAFFEQKNGMTGSSLGKLLAVGDITDVTTLDWRPSRFGLSHLIVAANNNDPYELEVALIHKAKAAKIVEAVQAQLSKAA